MSCFAVNTCNPGLTCGTSYTGNTLCPCATRPACTAGSPRHTDPCGSCHTSVARWACSTSNTSNPCYALSTTRSCAARHTRGPSHTIDTHTSQTRGTSVSCCTSYSTGTSNTGNTCWAGNTSRGILNVLKILLRDRLSDEPANSD